MRVISVLGLLAVTVTSVASLNAPPFPIHDLHRRQQLCNGTITLDNRTQSAVVQAGDTLRTIGARFNRGICDIARASNLTNPNLIFEGQTLTIPPQVCFPDDTTCVAPPPSQTETCVLGGPTFYLVQEGDTLASIARSLNLTNESLQAANANATQAAVGSFLTLPVCPNSKCTFGPYVIQPGDLFIDLAVDFGSQFGQISALNPNINANSLEAGVTITLPRDCGNDTAVN
ncbi:hypothetical protein CAC42_5568 [Sphaceloma murrayae]|uniref:LysM domain-containing protein n=1 Tax=Sphaceloma murrayae TaxID=2082308 RepID=A0A2K1QYJ1_9PEZI|nr:hypothetical protein CAC42_5568 [Sphaceloma murrayae]